ncbi:MAG: hypothetical protein C0609_07485 [Deltaproteobacteria bacterium]|nr:MAG: hypothetical protein C0609_07485 [Deltaproteobacteria bacterium]
MESLKMVQVEVDRWVAEGMLDEAHKLIRELRIIASGYPGFLSGSLFQRVEDHHHCSSVSRWQSKRDWDNWVASEARHTIASKISPMLDEPETVVIFEPF